ncbi:hypothetical protein [Rubricoccus marinus]|uniref:Uncharacterized protein n=1 Tax=Rubricoccus marinus TaxID=716817 RepID=A0A259TYG0_9BACT|nr:hypothetical protein [Rubricoccus marinus]OZC02730.1 hypothetical protein BSZ36_06930 [Rubricoccus marinus]
MDSSLLELIWILGVAGFYLWNAVRKNKAKAQRQSTAEPVASGETRGATPFQDFMRQMDEAMREAAGETVETREVEKPLESPDTLEAKPVPSSTVPASRIPASRVEEFHAQGSFGAERDFSSAAQTPHEVHGYGLDSPFSEERFERLPRGRDVTEHPPGHLDAGAHGRARPLPRRLSVAGQWRERLRDPKEAQDALVLSEIFGGPWKARRPHKR